MADIWSFLLQTLSVSGVAIFLLILKVLFKDKLPPKWQFVSWSALGLAILVPAYQNGRYVLFHWRPWIEALRYLFGSYGITEVRFPFPYIHSMPKTLAEWIFAVYVIGVVVHIAKYSTSYIRLKFFLKNGAEPLTSISARVHDLASTHGLRVCRIVAVHGLSGAFICGVIRPCLVISADGETDDKIILHELLHLKYRDTLWSILICLFRCLHWCNPLIAYCADRAVIDMEARCDQQVLELLDGEERREYGMLLLSMANERFSKTPGSTCLNNGGKNIRVRIEAIARFKKYPVGMKLVSVCVLIVLFLSVGIGVQAAEFREIDGSVPLSMAYARSTPCTTYAGAFDAYGKALLMQNGYYRAMCAPQADLRELTDSMRERDQRGIFPTWDAELPAWPDAQSGYFVYNLREIQQDVYRGMMVIKLNYPPNGEAAEINMMDLAVQTVRAEKENDRWVIIPEEAFQYVKAVNASLAWNCIELSGTVYTGVVENFRIDVTMQTVHRVESKIQENDLFYGTTTRFYTKPLPNATFDHATTMQFTRCTHLGTEAERNTITHIGLSIAPVYEGEARPDDMTAAIGTTSWGSSSNQGDSTSSQHLHPGWGPALEMGGGGGTIYPSNDVSYPEYYVADLYLNQMLVGKTDLHLREEFINGIQ